MTEVSESDIDPAHTIKITASRDLAAIVPYLLGFHPSLSLVVVMLNEEKGAVEGALRLDLPHHPAEAEDPARELMDILARNGVRRVCLIGYGPGHRVTPVMDVFRRVLGEAGITISEAMRIEDGRYWSYVCTDPSCCPPEGGRIDSSSSVPAAAAVVAGLVALPNRAALAATLNPPDGFDQAGACTAAQEVCARTRELIEEGRDWFGEGAEQITAALDRVDAGEALDIHTVTWLGLRLTGVAVRDIAMTYLHRYPADTHVRLWTEVTRKVQPAFAAAPATLLAFFALYVGDGALAAIGLERALATDPRYTMALLLDKAIKVAVPPSALFRLDWNQQADVISALAQKSPEMAQPKLPDGW